MKHRNLRTDLEKQCIHRGKQLKNLDDFYKTKRNTDKPITKPKQPPIVPSSLNTKDPPPSNTYASTPKRLSPHKVERTPPYGIISTTDDRNNKDAKTSKTPHNSLWPQCD